MRETILSLSKDNLAQMKEIRRHLHQHPELAHEEYETQKYVESVLDSLDIPHYRLADTGVVGIIEGAKPGKCVLLRGDMDALPVEEKADVEYKSLVSGKMHACGHDGHTAGLLGAAMILNSMKDEISGTIKLMFQPAEETDGGALPMIQEGLLENPKVDAAFGLHLGGHIPHGKVEVRYGAMYGAPDEFELIIHGVGGHAASPHQTVDPISIAAQIINNAQFILTRRLDPVKPCVVSFTTIHAGEGLNVISDTCTLGGTIRTLYPETRESIQKYMEELIESICTLNGATYSYTFFPSYPPLINDEAMTQHVEASLSDLLGEEVVQRQEFPSLGAEDFAFLNLEVPASYYNVGIWEEDKKEPVHHHPEFAWNDDVLETTAATLAKVAYDYLNQ